MSKGLNFISFMAYITILSAVPITQHQLVGWLVSSELEKYTEGRGSWPKWRYSTSICLEGLRKTTENLIKERCPKLKSKSYKVSQSACWIWTAIMFKASIISAALAEHRQAREAQQAYASYLWDRAQSGPQIKTRQYSAIINKNAAFICNIFLNNAVTTI
jgi:hypothetical protein